MEDNNGLQTPPWDDGKSRQQQREEDEHERWKAHVSACLSTCNICGETLWKGKHLEECDADSGINGGSTHG